MRGACDKTTGQRARMFLCGDESERCNASDQPDRLRDSFRHMPRSTILSTSVAISSRLQRSVGSVPKPSRHGAPPWALQPETAFICNRLDRSRQRDKPATDAEAHSQVKSAETILLMPDIGQTD